MVKSSKGLSGLTITGDAANAKLLFAPATEAKGFTPPASTNPGGGGTTPGVVSGRWTGVMTSTYGNKYTVSLLFVGDPVKYSGFVKYPANFEIQGLPQGTFSVPMDFNIDEVASSSSTTGGNAFAVDSGYLSELFFEVIFYEKDFGKNKYTIFVNICNAPNRDIQTRKYDYGYVDISRVQ